MRFFETLKQQKLLGFGLIFVTLAIGIVIGTFVNTGVRANHQTSPLGGAPDATPLVIPAAVPMANDFTRLTKKVEPSVVYIESDYLAKPGKKRPKGNNDDSEQDDNGAEPAPKGSDPSDMFRRFFGQEKPRSFRSEGTGTGFIVDKNGYIITNQHVIDKADRIKVKLSGEGEDIEYRAKVIGFDKETDLAVLKIDAKQPLVPVQIGNSESVQVGDWVIAIGSPFGLQATVTAGIISAERTSRDLPGAGEFQNFLQTDAAINPGNSGGPLLNIRGEVIGVNTMIATHSGSYEGIGFALPSNIAVRVYNELIRTGFVTRGSIGIRWARNDNQSETLRAFGLKNGVLVESVSPTGPAGRVGVKADDVIVAMNDQPVRDGQELVTKIADLTIGSVVVFTIDRDGKRMNFSVPVQERTKVWGNEAQISSNVAPTQPRSSSLTPAKFGITITRLSPKERKDLEIQLSDGVKVVAVDPGSFADDIGMLEGDAIISINRQTVATPDDLMRLQASLKPGQPVAIRIVRGSGSSRRQQPQRYYLSGRLPEP